jgi:hypothetical protein
MVWNGNWCGVDMRLTFSIGMLLLTCTCWLPWFSIANNIFQLSLLFSTINYGWKGIGNVVGKKGFPINVLEFKYCYLNHNILLFLFLSLRPTPFCYNKIWTKLCIIFMKLKFVPIEVLGDVLLAKDVKNVDLLLWVLHCKRIFSCHTLAMGFLICYKLEWHL